MINGAGCPVCVAGVFYAQKKRRLAGKGGEPSLGDSKASAFATHNLEKLRSHLSLTWVIYTYGVGQRSVNIRTA